MVSRTPLPVRKTLARRAPVRKRRKPTQGRPAEGVTPWTRAAVMGRSGGRCEVGGCNLYDTGIHVHHRQLRRSNNHTLPNLLAVCPEHHRQIHASPTTAYENGWMVRQTADPATTPVRFFNDRIVLLDEDGNWEETH